MNNEDNNLRSFGKFRLDSEKKVLWFADDPVNLALKEVELLCVLTENSGEVVTKDELLNKVWTDSFVEESNLSRHIYRLRKTFEEFGESGELIQTVPRRGYRFTGDIHQNGNRELIVERYSISQTLIEELEDSASPEMKVLPPLKSKWNNYKIPITFGLIFISSILGFYFYFRKPTERQNINSIAVLPLKTYSSNNNEEEISLRITDALITKLGGLKNTVVRPTNSVLRFAKADSDAVEAGKYLQVETVLDGRIQQEGEKLRVTLQLVSVNNGEHLWSGQFDGNANQILFLQDRISTALSPVLSGNKNNATIKNPTSNPQAFDLYSRGRFFWSKRTPEGYRKALEYFELAIKEDPNFALAYAGIADTYILLNQRNVLSSIEAFPKAEEAAKRALFLDESLSDIHNSLGCIYQLYYYDWANAEKHFRQAIALNPNNAMAYGWYGMLLPAIGRFEESQAILKKARELDPTSLNISVYLTVSYFMSRQYEEVFRQSKKTLELEPNTTTPYLAMTLTDEILGKYDAAVETELKRRSIFSPESVEPLRNAYKKEGIKGYWRKQIEFLTEESKKKSGLEWEIASRYAVLGDKENALSYIEKYSVGRGSSWSYLKVEPIWDNIRNEPRFQEVLRKMNLQ